jgi:glycosyltransferase involved in cell wall biosynthesis
MQDRVNVLLTTYNGSRFLREQLESIDAQTLPPYRVTIRDDGSTDDTNRRVEKWAAGRANVLLLRGPRLGVTNNFFAVLANPDTKSDYFAFADQDDVWLPDKMERAVVALRQCSSGEPAMYCTRVECVDESLRHLGYSKIPKRPGFANALVENIATGCTMMLNRCARELVCERLPQRALLHDWWCYLTISSLGKIFYDERPSIQYRQHASNVTGAATTQWELFRLRFLRFLQHKRGARLLSDQAVEFQRCFGDLLKAQDKKTLERFLSVRGSFGDRVSYNAMMDVWRQTWPDTMILRALILMGRV